MTTNLNKNKPAKKVIDPSIPVLPNSIKKLMFERDTLDTKLEITREELIEKYNTLWINPIFAKMSPTNKPNAVYTTLKRQNAEAVRSPSVGFTGYFVDISPVKDSNVNKRKIEGNEGVPEKFLSNVVGVILNEEEGTITPFAMTLWDDIAKLANNLVEGVFYKFKANKQRGKDTDTYRFLNSSKVTNFTQLESAPILNKKSIEFKSVEQVIRKYFPVVTPEQARNYAGTNKYVFVEGGITTTKMEPSTKGNYNFEMMSNDAEIDEDIEIVKVITPFPSPFLTGSDIATFGYLFEGNNDIQTTKEPSEDSDENEKQPATLLMMSNLVYEIEGGVSIPSDTETEFGDDEEHSDYLEDIDDDEEEVDEDDINEEEEPNEELDGELSEPNDNEEELDEELDEEM